MRKQLETILENQATWRHSRLLPFSLPRTRLSVYQFVGGSSSRGQAVNAFSESVYDDAVPDVSRIDQESGPRGVVYTSASCFPAIQKQRCLRHGRGNWLAFSKHAALSHLPRWMVYSVASASMLRGNVQWTVRAE